MAKPLVSDELWEIVYPPLPAPKPRRFRITGCKPLDDRKAPVSSTGQVLTCILFVRKSGPPAADRPRKWLRLRDDLLAPTAVLVASRSVAKSPGNAVVQIARGRTAWTGHGLAGRGSGMYRWVVERTLAWLHQFRRLPVRYECRTDIHEAFLVERLQGKSNGCSGLVSLLTLMSGPEGKSVIVSAFLQRPVEPIPDIPRDVLSSWSLATNSALTVVNRMSCAILSPAAIL